MRLDDLSGRVKVDPLQASTLIKTLFDPTDTIALSSKKVQRGDGVNVYTQYITALELITELCGPEGEELLTSLCIQPDMMDTYFGLAVMRPDSFRGMSKRVKVEDVQHVSLVYADLDVKRGSFISMQDALSFLGSLPYHPNAIVSSGSGGLHAYWRVDGFNGPNSINVQVAKDLLVHWWAYLSEAAVGRDIDKLVDITRMSRLPGTVRWPKNPNETPQPVELLYASREHTITAVEIFQVSANAWASLQRKRKEVRRKDENLLASAEKAAERVSGGRWAQLRAVASVESWVEEYVPWDNILTPLGWEYLREDGDGRREWQRPGGSGKSATTDWPESPHVMSLLSTSIETNLADLHDAGIALSKWRVLLRLNFGDDMDAAVSWVLSQMEKR